MDLKLKKAEAIAVKGKVDFVDILFVIIVLIAGATILSLFFGL